MNFTTTGLSSRRWLRLFAELLSDLRCEMCEKGCKFFHQFFFQYLSLEESVGRSTSRKVFQCLLQETAQQDSCCALPASTKECSILDSCIHRMDSCSLPAPHSFGNQEKCQRSVETFVAQLNWSLVGDQWWWSFMKVLRFDPWNRETTMNVLFPELGLGSFGHIAPRFSERCFFNQPCKSSNCHLRWK